MEKDEILKKVHQLEIKSKKHIQQLLSGAYHSVFKGKGIEFFDVKEYTFDDDIKDIDWNVTARADKPYVKNYVEERELEIIIAIDLSGSQNFGSQNQLKQELAIELGAVLAFAASQNRDKVGLCLFSDQIEKFVKPKRGRVHILRLIRDLIYHQSRNLKTNINLTLEFLQKSIKKKSVIFLISDFIDDKDFSKPLIYLGKKHDLVAMKITDPFEEHLPKAKYIRLWDNEEEKEALIQLNEDAFHRNYRKLLEQQNLKLKNLFSSANIDYLNFKTNQAYIPQLAHFFMKRAKRY